MSALQPAHSSWIAFHGYANGTMTLITKTGESYAAAIPESRYISFVKSPSPGSFFNTYIKPFATVTKVDVTEDVALVEKAKAKLVLDSKIDEIKVMMEAAASPNSKTCKVPRKAPAKSKLPNKPWDGKDSAWIDFRCIADPTTDPALVKALKRYIELKGSDRQYGDYLPYTSLAVTPPAVAIAALDHWGEGYVDPKYLKMFPFDTIDHKGLARAYRSAYRSWVRRNEARAAKARGANVKAIETAAKEVFAGGWSGKTAEQVRAERAERVLSALLNGDFSVTGHRSGVTLNLWGSSNESFKLGEKRP